MLLSSTSNVYAKSAERLLLGYKWLSRKPEKRDTLTHFLPI